jgi:hypothetical protein
MLYFVPKASILYKNKSRIETLCVGSQPKQEGIMRFNWQRYPDAADWIDARLEAFCREQPVLSQWRDQLGQKTGTRLLDWVDHLRVHPEQETRSQLEAVGYHPDGEWPSLYRLDGSTLPPVMLTSGKNRSQGVALRVEQLEAFALANALPVTIEGDPLAGYRQCCVLEDHIGLWAVERRSSGQWNSSSVSSDHLSRIVAALELWQTRPRGGQDEAALMEDALHRTETLVRSIGQQAATHVVMDSERQYWQSHNWAGQIQKARQDRLGLGWANFDHHTFRSSRRHFVQLVRLFEHLGFVCREKFYAGEEAGWGAQVVENTTTGHALFLDLDLAPEEVDIDFAHQPLSEPDELGTVGLWCALHGDSILSGGLHHLAARFDFEPVKEDLATLGIEMMPPFSSFDYLKQAFTRGELRSVDPQRLTRLVSAGRLDSKAADRFEREGVLASHLEDIERNQGFKGFNQTNVSKIIRDTDPRRGA